MSAKDAKDAKFLKFLLHSFFLPSSFAFFASFADRRFFSRSTNAE